MKSLKTVIAVLLCVLLIPCAPVCVFAHNAYVAESFNSYATNASPDGISVSTDRCYIKEYGTNEKGLALFADKTISTASVDVAAGEVFCLSFDIMSIGDGVDGAITLGGSAASTDIFKLGSDKRISAYNNMPLFGYNNSVMTSVAVVYNGEKSSCDIYRNGKCVQKDMRISTTLIGTLQKITVSIMSEGEGNGIIIDNICVSDALTPDKAHLALVNKADYNEEALDEPTFAYGAKVGADVLFNADFEGSVPTAIYTNGNICKSYKDEDGNTAILFERGTTAGDFHMTASGFVPNSDVVVFEYDLKNLHADSVFNMALKDTNNKESNFGSLTKGSIYKCGNASKKLELGKWYRMSFIINTYERSVDYYIDGEKVSTNTLGSGFAAGSVPSLMRVHCTIHSPFGNTATFEDYLKFEVDNMRVYEGENLVEDLGNIKREIRIGTKSVLESDASLAKSLAGYVTLHTRSGVTFANDKKGRLATLPYEKDGNIYVDAQQLANAFGITTSLSGDVTIGTFASAAGYIVTSDNTTVNDGMVIFGKSGYNLPKDAEMLQKLNDFTFFYRPSPEEIEATYASYSEKGNHPRIQATKSDFDKIREEIKTDPYKKAWSEQIIRAATSLINVDPVKYELRDGVRLLYVSRDVLSNMYTLGMAYQLTGERKFVDRAWLDLNAVCAEFYDWHPSHDIDLGEMCAATALGYDWMYDAFTDEQRQIIEDGMYQNGLYHASLVYQTLSSPMGSMAVGSANHNIVCNGGIAMAALALMDVYPTECNYLVSNAVRSADICIRNFAPDGAWYEGPHYWEYAMEYTAKLLSSLDSALGTSFGLENIAGMNTAAEFMMYMQSSEGIYNYGDGIETVVYSPEMLWLTKKFDAADTAAVYMSLTGGNLSSNKARALGLIWYNIDTPTGEITLQKDRYYKGEDSISMRESWADPEGAFVGIHAGKTNVPHSQLDGASFVYDYNGVRWARDLGMGNYNLPGYWDSAEFGRRWNVFKSRAESHNTIVVDPSALPDHKVNSFAKMELVSAKDRGAIVKVDTTQLLHSVSSGTRGFFFTDNRKSLVVRDEVSLTKATDVYWFMITTADVTTDATGAYLTENGNTIRLDFVSNANAKIEVGKTEPLPTSPVTENDEYPNANRIIIKATGSGDVNITVKLTPEGINATPVSDYDKPIAQWQVPDGPIPAAPYIDTLTVDGKDVQITGRNIVYNYVEGELTSVPEIVAHSDNYDVQISKATTLSDVTEITVVDRADATNKTIYKLTFNDIPKPIQFEGMNSLPIMGVNVSAEPQVENNAMNVFDNDINTRWSAEGVGQWVTVDIGSVSKLGKVALAFYLGHQRQTKITISVSKDGYEFEEVYRGLSTGTTDSYEFYDLGNKDARYVQIGCDGTTTGTWNSVSEIVVIEAN